MLNRYSYGLNNPVKYIDPTGHCGEPFGGRVICMDLFIKPERASVGPFIAHGDGRDFNPYASPNEARLMVWVFLDEGRAAAWYSSSTTDLPIGDPATGDPLKGNTTIRTSPNPEDWVNVTFNQDGTVSVDYHGKISGPANLFDPPALDGNIVFDCNSAGCGWSGNADAYPWKEAGLYMDGNLIQVIDRRSPPNGKEDPLLLFGIEGGNDSNLKAVTRQAAKELYGDPIPVDKWSQPPPSEDFCQPGNPC